DWNVTARFGQPFVKSYIEERELTVIFLVDISASGQFGSEKQLKKEVAAELCAALAFNAIKKNDRVGLILFSDQIELYIPPKKGKTHVLRVIRELLVFQPRHQRTSIHTALEFLNRVNRRRAVVFLVSDFLDTDYFKNLNLTNKRHDLVAVEVVDPSETEPALMGLVEMLDPETGEHLLVDTSNSAWRERYRSIRMKFNEERNTYLRKIGVDCLKIRTDQPFEHDLINFFKNRSLRP
ncbi:MAG: VWA domain-containing protein, partial [SAR324 cluster bacterium]|nr:VWA domain-containing protein [SAR324 cluster bacterium]